MPTTIPLTSDPSQTFSIDLEGNTYNFRVVYNQRNEMWTFDLSDVDENPILAGIPILIGPNLLQQFTLDLGSLIVWDNEDQLVDSTTANDDDLGTRVILVHYTPDEVAEASA